MSEFRIEDYEALNGLSPEERAAALAMLREFGEAGYSKTYNDMVYSDYEEIPVDIETFMFDKNYLGNGLVDAEGRKTVYPYWINTLKKIFPNNVDTAYNTLIFTGAIGLGKSFIAVICELYMMYRMICLKDPYLYYGMQPIDKISFSMISFTLDAAKGVAWDKMQQLLQSSPWFMSHGKITGTDNLVWKPVRRKGQIGTIELVVGSKESHITGRAVFCLDGDTEIVTTNGIDKLKDLVGKDIRVLSIDETGSKVISDLCTVEQTAVSMEEYEIELEDGTILKCTPDHRFMLKDGTYKEARNLTEDDELADVTGLSYFEFIDSIIKSRGQWEIPKGEYWEGHHIIPKCLGGDGYSRSKHPNIIRLYPEEHYMAHKLLALENPDNKALVSAWEMMIHPKGSTKREYAVSSEDYALSRTLWSKHMSDNNPLKGKEPWNKGKTGVYSDETMNKLRKPRPNMKGVKFSDEHRMHISEAVSRRFVERPDSFRTGTKGKVAITNGEINRYIDAAGDIPEGFHLGMTKSGYSIHDKQRISKIRSDQCSGEGNPMYGNGHRISGGNNGHATIRYFYGGDSFECRKDLLAVLQRADAKISSSTIRKLIAGSLRVLREHPILRDVSWEMKS